MSGGARREDHEKHPQLPLSQEFEHLERDRLAEDAVEVALAVLERREQTWFLADLCPLPLERRVRGSQSSGWTARARIASVTPILGDRRLVAVNGEQPSYTEVDVEILEQATSPGKLLPRPKGSGGLERGSAKQAADGGAGGDPASRAS